MPQFSAILRSVDADKFGEILAASGRKAREVYFRRHDIRAPRSGGLPKAGAKNEYRTAQLFSALRERDDDEMAEEILRTWLLGKRDLLAAAMDHLGIPHRDGLTDSDEVGKIEKLGPSELEALVVKLCELAPRADVLIYLRFMGAQWDQ